VISPILGSAKDRWLLSSPGFARRIAVGYVKGLARRFTVYSIYRRVGLPEGVTVKEIAAD
jgi:hypothetical protein